MQAYSDPSRENDPYALPDLEIFELTAEEAVELNIAESGTTGGWFWQSCFPGCLPDSEPIGPFPSAADALADAQENSCD